MSNTTSMKHPSWLTSGDFTAADDPFALFAAWLEEATASEPRDPTAMTLATVDGDGLPNARMVLLKGADARGFVFFTNMGSQKGRELDAHPKAALVFHWKSLNKQVRVRGRVEHVTGEEADAYFATRAKQAHLFVQRLPMEHQRRFRVRVQLPPLLAAHVREEDESPRIGALEQHHPGIRQTVAIDRGERHGRRIARFRGGCLLQPCGKQRKWIVGGREITTR